MHLTFLIGPRADLIKAAPIVDQIRGRFPGWRVSIVHSGIPFDDRVSDTLFVQLGLPVPDDHLNVDAGTPTYQTAAIMLALEGRLRLERTDLLVVFGDSDTTLAGALAAKQMDIDVVHVEAGLRAHEPGAAVELNSMLTDVVASLHFVTERAAELNLQREGVAQERIHLVGNTTIDTLVRHRRAAHALCVPQVLGLKTHDYVVVTLDRRSNVGTECQLRSIVYALQSLADHTDVVFPTSPETVQRLKDLGLWPDMDRQGRLRVMKPLGYLEFLGLLEAAGAVLTDSGGVQEEAVVLGVPCVTLRTSTDRPVTLLNNGNRLAGTDPHLAVRYICDAIEQRSGMVPIPDCWDGRASARIVEVLERHVMRATPVDGRVTPVDRRVTPVDRAIG